jgi:hypothetical protein
MRELRRMRFVSPILLLLAANLFMTFAWYGHLKWIPREAGWRTLLGAIFISWGLAFFEYTLQVPANRLGFQGHGGPYTLLQLKVIQEVVTLLVFLGVSRWWFKDAALGPNQWIGLGLLVAAVYFIFRDAP